MHSGGHQICSFPQFATKPRPPRYDHFPLYQPSQLHLSHHHHHSAGQQAAKQIHAAEQWIHGGLHQEIDSLPEQQQQQQQSTTTKSSDDIVLQQPLLQQTDTAPKTTTTHQRRHKAWTDDGAKRHTATTTLAKATIGVSAAHQRDAAALGYGPNYFRDGGHRNYVSVMKAADILRDRAAPRAS